MDHPSKVVITGVTRGLGRAMASEFIRLGHIVLGCARTRQEIEQLARLHPKHDFKTVDVASDRDVGNWARSTIGNYGPPDLVLNNAAVINLKACLWNIEDRDFSEEIDINVKGVVNVIRHFAPSMIRRGGGTIVNFSSRWGKKFEKQMAPYCATKWAVVALTKALAEELKPEGVVAVAINPGIVRTAMLQRYLGGTAIDTSEYLAPDEWAKIAVPFILGLRSRDAGKVRNILKPSIHDN